MDRLKEILRHFKDTFKQTLEIQRESNAEGKTDEPRNRNTD